MDSGKFRVLAATLFLDEEKRKIHEKQRFGVRVSKETSYCKAPWRKIQSVLSSCLLVFAIIELFAPLFTWQQSWTDPVSIKACILLDLIGCFGQKWHWRAERLRMLSWKFHFYADPKRVAQQERSSQQKRCTIATRLSMIGPLEKLEKFQSFLKALH